MGPTCKYCNEQENKQDKPGLSCESCLCFVHLTCLRRPGTPGDFDCDVFFDFICEDCSTAREEVFTRKRIPWVNIIFLVLHHLSLHAYGISNHGYFHYKSHICFHIDRYWHLLFGARCKQKKNWMGTIAGALSVYNNWLFRSGSLVLGETGWWQLQHKFSPAVADHIIQKIRHKPKARQRNQLLLKSLFMTQVTELGYKHLLNTIDHVTEVKPEPAPKKRRLDSSTELTSTSIYDQYESDARLEGINENSCDAIIPSRKGSSYSETDVLKAFDYPASSSASHFQSDTSSIASMQQSLMYYDSDSRSISPHNQQETQSDEYEAKKPGIKSRKIDDIPVSRETLFSKELNTVELPWVTKVNEASKEDLVEMTQYEEIQLLKQVESMIPKIKDPNKKAYLCRLKAKLALRRWKRHKHLPVFDLDKTVKVLGGYVPENVRVVSNVERVLDRFQRSYLIEALCGTVRGGAGGCGGAPLAPRWECAPLRSLHSHVTLRPYIRRDVTPDAIWLRLMDELLVKTHRHVKGYSAPARASLDYSYVRPQHIAAVNSLCAQYFWPGIDLSEALQYPEHSCVVTYRRAVVACAFLVPGNSTSPAYLSFLLTRPEWRRSHIATFMLYHLLQTCTGMDVTLHVSPTNPAIFLYQKFGFKVEEFVQDFYEKYFDIDYKGCRHALFLRLIR